MTGESGAGGAGTGAGGEPPAAFGALLRAHRRAAGLTQEALAERAGLSRRGLQHLEAGDARPYPDTLEALAAALALAPAERARLRAAVPAPPARPRPAAPADGPGGRRPPGAGPAGLPAPLTSFVGREREVAAVREALLGDGVRLLTLTGPGGTGKTRLALQAAADALEAYPDGVWLAELAALADPALVPQAVAVAVGVREEPGRPLPAALTDALRSRRVLLVLDNCEHVLAGVASLVAGLLAACPGVRVLATSREVLRLSGEHVFAVPPLALPAPAAPASPEHVAAAAAVRLFEERARAADSGFALTPENAGAVAEVCRRLDGLPLALELAAARARLLPPAALLARLECRLPLLTAGPRDAPARQRTLRATIAWSHDLLAPDERALFRRLAVFAGGCTLEAVEAVGTAAGELATAVLDGLGSLVDKSLVQRREAPGGAPRLTMLETIREYALERLEASGEADAVRREHARYFVALAERAWPHMHRAAQLAWTERFEREHDNLRAVLRWAAAAAGAEPGAAPDGVTTADTSAEAEAALERAEAVELGLRLGGALWHFWYYRGYLSEGRAWLAALLGGPGAPRGGAPRARALCGAGALAFHQGDTAAAGPLLGESVALWRALGDRSNDLATAVATLGRAALAGGREAEARACYEESLGLRRALGDRSAVAHSLHLLGGADRHRGDVASARARWEEALALWRAEGNHRGVAWALCLLAGLAREGGDLAAARGHYEEGLALFRWLGDGSSLARTLPEAAFVFLARGDDPAAAALFGEALALPAHLTTPFDVARCLAGLAAVAAGAGQPERAARLYGAAEARQAAAGVALPPADQTEIDRRLAAAGARLGATLFVAAREAGRALPPQQVTAAALAAASAAADARPRPPAPAKPARPGSLTAREAEVLHLVAAGKTDRQIAADLVLSEATVGRHLANIYNKLGVSSRAAATAFALREGLA
jgi:non-specific serine/threonine protein kinase